MNSSSNSVLLATGQVCRDREVPVTIGSLSCLSCTLSCLSCALSRAFRARCARCQACTVHMVVCAVRAGGSVSHAASPLVCVCSCMCLGLSCTRPSPRRTRMPALWVAIEKNPVATPPLENLVATQNLLSRQECPTLGKTLS